MRSTSPVAEEVFLRCLTGKRQELFQRCERHANGLRGQVSHGVGPLIDAWKEALANLKHSKSKSLTLSDDGMRALLPRKLLLKEAARWAPLLQAQLWAVALEERLTPSVHEAAFLAMLVSQASPQGSSSWTRLTQHAKAEQHLRRVIDMTEIGWFHWHIETDSVEMSERMSEQWQVQSHAPLARALARIHPDDRLQVTALIEEAMSRHKPFVTEYRLLLDDGSIRWIDARGRVFYSDDGAPQHFVGTSTDISKQKDTERQQENERQWLETVLARLPVPVVMVEPKTGEHTFANGAASAMWGAPFDVEARGRDHGVVFDVRDASGQRLTHEQLPSHRSANGELLQNYEMTWQTRDATYDLLFSSASIPAMFGREEVIVCLTQDVTALKHHQRMLQQNIEQWRQERKRLDQQVAVLMHDVRTPLTAASLAAQSAMRTLQRDVERTKRNLERIDANLQRVDAMVQRLLDDKGAQQDGQWPIQRQPARLGKVLEEGVRELNSMHDGRVEFDNSLGEAQFDCDEQALRRVLDNLVNNAVKYGEPDAPISVKFSGSRGRVSLQVHNSGTPISAADQAALFAPYFRAERAEKSDAPGWGLGLSGVYDIARAHGGNVCLSSSAQHGTTFDVTFPAAHVSG